MEICGTEVILGHDTGLKKENFIITKIDGELEIDHDRGVIYFHTSDPEIIEKFGGSVTILRICSLPKSIPERAIDITHMVGCDWSESK